MLFRSELPIEITYLVHIKVFSIHNQNFLSKLPDKISNLKNLEKAFYILENNGEDCLNYYLKAWDFSNPIRLLKDENIEISFKIPSVSYDETLLRFYKNAIVAETVNHSFLSFYHVIEFYFLKLF